MVEVFRTVEERRRELRETAEELRPLAAKEQEAHEAYKAAEAAWREAKKAASKVRDRRNAQLRGLAPAVEAGLVQRQAIADDAGVVPRHLRRLLGDEEAPSDS